MATTPKAQASLAKSRAQELLDFNNAAQSNKSDKLLSILEAGEGSSIARDQLDHYLHNYLEAILAPGGVPTLNYQWTQLRKCLSIKEKISFAAGIAYAYEGETVHGVVAASSENIADERLRETLNDLTLKLEDNVINNRDFTESRILRNAAVNRFECKLSTTETHQLNEFGTKIKTECNNNGLETLGESTHFTNESDAQKIMKLSDIMIQMSAAGVNVDEKLLKSFEKFNEKIKPLKDLDKHYKHITKTLNMLHRVAQKGYHAMIKPAQQEKLQTILSKVDMLKTVNDALIGFNNIENFEKNEEHGFLDKLLVQITSRSNFKETLYSMAISEPQFNEWFYSACTFNLMQVAKNGLHHQKGIAFGNRLKDFEADTQSRRGLVRRRIFDIADRMPGNDFSSDVDFETANSYFNKFKDLFFAKEEDNYRNAPNAEAEVHYDKMRKVISAIVRRRVPALASSHRIRRGSAGRIVYKIIENGLKGKDSSKYSWMKRVRHNADDATILAMVIMTQNEATNQVFYQDQDKTKKSDSRWGKLWNKISFTEHGRRAVRDAVAPTVNKALTFTEESVKKGLQLTKGVAKVGNKIVSKTARGLTRSLGGLSGGFNTMIKRGGYKRWKTPLYIPYIATAAIEPLAKLGYKGATYTDRMGNKHLDTVGKVVGQGYNEAKKLVSKATGEEVNYLFQGLTYTTEQVTKLAGKTISATGKRVHDGYTTGQQRSILGAFYSAAKEQKGLEDLMQSSDLADILNLKERGPYLFDEDGRIVISDTVEKKDKSSPEAAGKDFGEELEKQYKKALKQAEADILKREKEYEDAIAKADDNQKIQANIRLQNAQTTSNAISSLGAEMSGLINIIKRPMNNAVPPARRHAEINGRIVALRVVVGPIIAGINIPTLQADCSAAFRNLQTHSGEVSRREETIKNLKNGLSRGNAADRAALVGQIAIEEAALQLAIDAKITDMETYNQRQAELLESQKRLGFMNRINQMINKIDDIDTRMTAATTDDERKEIAKELVEYTKDLNLLLYPEGQKEKNKDTINLKDVTQEQRKQIEELLKSA